MLGGDLDPSVLGIKLEIVGSCLWLSMQPRGNTNKLLLSIDPPQNLVSFFQRTHGKWSLRCDNSGTGGEAGSQLFGHSAVLFPTSAESVGNVGA